MRPFDLVEPSSLAEAVQLLDPTDPLSKPIAGGTALMLMMKSGVFQPNRLVSLRLVEPRHSQFSLEAGGLRAGALVTLGAIERSPAVAAAYPVIAHTLLDLSNTRVRNVATIGGNLAHADPHMDLPPVLIALGAHVQVIGPAGTRRIAVEDLYRGYYETVLEPNELISELHVPAQSRWRSVYKKCTTRSAHDWPVLGVAVSVLMDNTTIRQARVVLSAATEIPLRIREAEDMLCGTDPGADAFRAAGEAAAAAEVVPDVLGSAPYKRQLIRVYVARALQAAVFESSGNGANR